MNFSLKGIGILFGVLLVVVASYVGYMQLLNKGTIAKEEPHAVANTEPEVAKEQAKALSPQSTPATFTRTYEHFGITFMYEDAKRFKVEEYTNNIEDIDMASVQLYLKDAKSDTIPVFIYLLGKGYCYLGWCELKEKSSLVSNGRTWEFLGSTMYSDAGEHAEFPNLYRTYNGDFPVYIVTPKPIDPTDASSISAQVLNSLHFTK